MTTIPHIPHRIESPPASLEAVPQQFGYPRHYAEHLADLVGEHYAIKTFFIHNLFEAHLQRLGITPLTLAEVCLRLSDTLGFERGLAAVATSGYDTPIDPEKYEHQLQEEFSTAQLETLGNEFPQARQQIPQVVAFLNGSAQRALSFYFNHEEIMKEKGVSIPAFAYLVSQLCGPLEERLSIAHHLPALARAQGKGTQDATLDHLIRSYNLRIQGCNSRHPFTSEGEECQNSKESKPRYRTWPCARPLGQGLNAADAFNPERLYLNRQLVSQA